LWAYFKEAWNKKLVESFGLLDCGIYPYNKGRGGGFVK
jgi:hypothetical protein